MLRTPFTQRVRPYRDRPDLVCDLVWYPCQPDAKALPFPTVFNANLYGGDWWEREGLGPVGYVGKANWEGPKLSATGQYPCLTREEAADGFQYDPDAVCERNGEGIPECCGLVIVSRGGGRMAGGNLILSPRGGGLGSGRTRSLVTRGGGLGSGRTRSLASYGGGLGSGRTRSLASYGGAWGGGTSTLTAWEECGIVNFGGATPATASLMADDGESCTFSGAQDQWWLVLTTGGSGFRLRFRQCLPTAVATIYDGTAAGPTTVLGTIDASGAWFTYLYPPDPARRRWLFLVPDTAGFPTIFVAESL